MAKYTYRFHSDAWVDITVEADNEYDASMIAYERYNNGDYDDCDTDFENTHSELIKTE